jgi:hypothetical protein
MSNFERKTPIGRVFLPRLINNHHGMQLTGFHKTNKNIAIIIIDRKMMKNVPKMEDEITVGIATKITRGEESKLRTSATQ